MRSGDEVFLKDGPLYQVRSQLVMPSNEMVKRVFLEEVDQFSEVAVVDGTQIGELLDDNNMLASSEESVKRAIHAILGDPRMKKDWGGERSDVFTDEVRIGGRRTPTAMALKGPSGKARVTISSYGSNGDQIVRLFEEPAELYVVQANGTFESTLVKHVQQTATAQGRPCRYCLVDGRETARMLVAYADLLTNP